MQCTYNVTLRRVRVSRHMRKKRRMNFAVDRLCCKMTCGYSELHVSLSTMCFTDFISAATTIPTWVFISIARYFFVRFLPNWGFFFVRFS